MFPPQLQWHVLERGAGNGSPGRRTEDRTASSARFQRRSRQDAGGDERRGLRRSLASSTRGEQAQTRPHRWSTCGLSDQLSGASIHDVTARYSGVCSLRSVPRLSSTSSTFSLFLSHSPLPLFVLFFLVSYPVVWCVEQNLGSTGLFSTRRFLELWMAFKQPDGIIPHVLHWSLCGDFPEQSFAVVFLSAFLPQLGFHVQVSPSWSRHLQRLRAKGVHGTQAVFWMDALLNPTWHLHFRVSGHETSPNPGGQQGSWVTCDHRVPGLTCGDGGAAPSTVSQTGSRSTF